jgi:circadian clock protein KaiB
VSTGGHDATLRRFEARTETDETAEYVLTLFVTGASDMSARAIRSVRAICEEHLAGRYQLAVVDVHRDASLMSAHDVVAAPTLIKESPLPKRMLVGDLSDTARVLASLDIAAREPTFAAPPVTVG